MLTELQKQLLTQHFAQFISEPRRETIERVLSHRTKQVTVVMEDLHQSQNTNAVIRTCECMGLHEVHIIENSNRYELNVKVAKGAYKWMNLIRYKAIRENNTARCFEHLRADGYKILTTDPSADGLSIEDVQVDQKLAIVFGNELNGTSAFALANADARVKIPMFGFTESLNISVSAAICLNTILPEIRKSGLPIGLRENELVDVRYQWYRKAIRKADIIERDFLKTLLR